MAVQAVKGDDPFPWHVGVYDSHCHPTDTMSLVESIPAMKAKILTVMATRAQDQELVEQLAEKYGGSADDLSNGRVVPCFGWHPWFSHQLYDETKYNGAHSLSEDQKIEHYRAVLTPKKAEISDADRQLFLAFPNPRPFSRFLAETKERLQKFPVALVGEVGLDRSFRIPEIWLPEQQEQRDDSLTPGGREGRRLSPYHVSLDHQKSILLAQLRLAAEMQRAVSVHGVQAHGLLFETLKQTWVGHEKHVPSKREKKNKEKQQATTQPKEPSEQSTGSFTMPYPPRICLHSYSGNKSALQQYWDPRIPVDIFASFSTAINMSDKVGESHNALFEVIRSVPDDRLLIESDLHTAGPAMDGHLEDIVRAVCTAKEWSLEDGARRLARNWRHFVLGQDAP